MTRAELLERATSAELTEWAAYEKVSGPLGGERGDVQAALVAYHVVTALGAKGVRPDRLVPRWDRGPAQDWRQMKAAAEAHTRLAGGSVAG